MVKSILALYDDFETTDDVIEALLDAGFSHTQIMIKSGDYWEEELASRHLEQLTRPVKLSGNEVVLELLARNGLEEAARNLICNSGPIDVREWEEPENLTLENWVMANATVQVP